VSERVVFREDDGGKRLRPHAVVFTRWRIIAVAFDRSIDGMKLDVSWSNKPFEAESAYDAERIAWGLLECVDKGHIERVVVEQVT